MATKVIMPKQGLQMTEGTILKWLVPEGGKVVEDEPLFEIETDKLTIEIDAPVSGTLLKIVRYEGEEVPIAETIGIIGEEGENISLLISESEEKEVSEEQKIEGSKDIEEITATAASDIKRNPSSRVFITPRAKMRAEERGIDYKQVLGSGPEELIIERDILEFNPQNQVKSTPVAAKMAKARGIDLVSVDGTGVSGRIMKEDIESLEQLDTVHTFPVQERAGTVVPFKGMRKIISDRMVESLQTAAQANHTIKVDMSEAIRMREQLKEEGVKISFNDILTKVVSKVLLEFSYMNSSIVKEGILLKDYVNMGLAVSVENGLIVPNIKNADLLSLQEIAAISSELINKAQNNQLTSEDYANGTFTITNLGMFDIDAFTAVINPPESGILAVGKIDKTPVVEDDEVVIRPMITLKLTYDHRVIDGAPAAQFLQRIKQILLKPYLLL